MLAKESSFDSEEKLSRSNKIHDTRLETHIETDWSDEAEFSMLRKMGCIDPEPDVLFSKVKGHHGDVEIHTEYFIRCGITGNCFSPSEARGLEPYPTPEELIEQRNAIRDSWDDETRELRARSNRADERSEQGHWMPPEIHQGSELVFGASLSGQSVAMGRSRSDAEKY